MNCLICKSNLVKYGEALNYWLICPHSCHEELHEYHSYDFRDGVYTISILKIIINDISLVWNYEEYATYIKNIKLPWVKIPDPFDKDKFYQKIKTYITFS